MARFIIPATYDGAQVERRSPLEGGDRVRLWTISASPPRRHCVLLEGDDAQDALTELGDLMAGHPDPDDEDTAPRVAFTKTKGRTRR